MHYDARGAGGGGQPAARAGRIALRLQPVPGCKRRGLTRKPLLSLQRSGRGQDGASIACTLSHSLVPAPLCGRFCCVEAEQVVAEVASSCMEGEGAMP